jgi:hypothetical protein
MNFNIDNAPPGQDALDKERASITGEIKRLSTRDTLITITIIIFSSFLLGVIVYWSTDSFRIAGLSVAVFPVLGTILSLTGVTKAAGFRSAANSINELNNELVALNPVSEDSMQDIHTLSQRHNLVKAYQEKVVALGRPTVNGELAMYWEFDTSTLGKTAKGRDFLTKAKDSVAVS